MARGCHDSIPHQVPRNRQSRPRQEILRGLWTQQPKRRWPEGDEGDKVKR